MLTEIAEWDPAGRVVTLDSDAGSIRSSVDVVMATTRVVQPAWRLAEQLLDVTETPVDVSVQYRVEIRDEATAQ